MIEAKKQGRELAAADIHALVQGFLRGRVPDYQMAAWLMAVRWRGLSADETFALTDAYLNGSERVTFASEGPPVVDKHSTGGVGDKLSLIVVPLAAACGLRVAKMSGRGLGLSGGTIDKLESIPGLVTNLTPSQFARQVDAIGLAIAGHSATLTPADAKTYALRDVTSTIDSIPLIAASIASKKLALATNAVVFDVKVGRGAFMTTREDARELARMLLALMAAARRPACAVLTRMDDPLGRSVGHSLEVCEALDVLHGGGDSGLRDLAVELVDTLLELTGFEPSLHPREALHSGAAYERFAALVRAQGGDLATFERAPPHARLAVRQEVRSSVGGFVHAVDASRIAGAVRVLGGGRRVKDDEIDRGVGVVLEAAAGGQVGRGDRIAMVYARDAASAAAAAELVASAFTMQSVAAQPVTPVLEWIGPRLPG